MKDKKRVVKKKKIPKKKNIKKNVKKNNTYITKHGKKEKKVRVRYGRIIIFFLIIISLLYVLINYVKIPIRNIIVSGNTSLSDQEIIDESSLRDYPSVLSFTTDQIENKLEKNIYIDKVEIRKNFRTIYIEVKENYGLFYNKPIGKTIMYNNKTINKEIDCPILVNYVTENVYDLFVEKMKLLDRNIINRVSEIKYDPNTVDEERFLFTMSDGNYVYITLEKLIAINNYVDIIKTFEQKKGILYLDSGQYFKVFEN